MESCVILSLLYFPLLPPCYFVGYKNIQWFQWEFLKVFQQHSGKKREKRGRGGGGKRYESIVDTIFKPSGFVLVKKN